MVIVSREPLSGEDLKKIEDILRESNCPHESFTNTFPNYTGIYGDKIVFDDISPDDFKEESAPD